MKYFVYTTPVIEEYRTTVDPKTREEKQVLIGQWAPFREEAIDLANALEADGREVVLVDWAGKHLHLSVPSETCLMVEADDGLLLLVVKPEIAEDLDPTALLRVGGLLDPSEIDKVETAGRAIIAAREVEKSKLLEDRGRIAELLTKWEKDPPTDPERDEALKACMAWILEVSK